MKYLKLVCILLLLGALALSLVGITAEEFDPSNLNDGDVTYQRPCYDYYCIVVVKEGEQYLVLLEIDSLNILFIYHIVGTEAQLVWGRDLI